MDKTTPGKMLAISAARNDTDGCTETGREVIRDEQHIPKECHGKRKPLLPHFKEATKQGKRAWFVGPTLLVDGHFVTTGVPSHQA